MAKEAKQKKNKHTGTKVGIAAVILAALFGGGYFALGGGAGLGIDGIFKGTNQNTEVPTKESEKIPESTEAESEKNYEDDTVLEIVITETGIVYEGKNVTESELETAILSDFTGNVVVTVKDDHAIKSTYDEVTALLTKLNIPYSEVE